MNSSYKDDELLQDEEELVKEYKAGHIKGDCAAPVLFEEADGVYVSLQGKDRIEKRKDKAEIKVGIAYDGWKKTGKDRYELPNKVAVAGFARAKEFQE